jgi:hypothetical protein
MPKSHLLSIIVANSFVIDYQWVKAVEVVPDQGLGSEEGEGEYGSTQTHFLENQGVWLYWWRSPYYQ